MASKTNFYESDFRAGKRRGGSGEHDDRMLGVINCRTLPQDVQGILTAEGSFFDGLVFREGRWAHRRRLLLGDGTPTLRHISTWPPWAVNTDPCINAYCFAAGSEGSGPD